MAETIVEVYRLAVFSNWTHEHRGWYNAEDGLITTNPNNITYYKSEEDAKQDINDVYVSNNEHVEIQAVMMSLEELMVRN